MSKYALTVFALFLSLGGPRVARAEQAARTPTKDSIRLLREDADQKQLLAQEILLQSPDVQKMVHDPRTGALLRTEVFNVYPAPPSDITEQSKACRQTTCYRVDVYSYALNLSFHALVDVIGKRVVSLSPYQAAQPELPKRLTALAVRIATTAPAVEKALGFKPSGKQAMMPNVKTALNHTLCESSHHLCVAPTFILKDQARALWAIVDLTDEKLVTVRWTDLGSPQPVRPTEQSIERQDIYDKYCKQEHRLDKDGWSLSYILTGSDGLRISDVRFRGQPVLHDAKLVDWHVSYSTKEGFGYSDAVGCPMFSAAAVGAAKPPEIEDVRHDGKSVGFALVQDFAHPMWPAPCNYRYLQRYEFYADGRFRVAAGQYGRGCGTDGTYRPVLRIHPAATPGLSFSEWDGKGWKEWTHEQWDLQKPDTAYTPQGYQYRLTRPDGSGYYIEPGRGQFPHNRGDNAYVYVTRYKPDEGDADMITIGPCCNTDYRQGPERFIDSPPEPIANTDLVLWYVAQQHNDGRPGHEYCWAELQVKHGIYQPKAFPCYIGPMFVPIVKPATTAQQPG